MIRCSFHDYFVPSLVKGMLLLMVKMDKLQELISGASPIYTYMCVCVCVCNKSLKLSILNIL